MTVPKADWDDDLFDHRRRPPPAVIMPLVLLGATALWGFAMGGTSSAIQKQPQQRPNATRLIVSPNDPQMLQSIRYAQTHARSNAGGNAWSKPKIDGQSVTFQTVGGPITLSRAEIAEANELYPYLVKRAKNPDTFRSAGRSADDDFDSEPNNNGGWGN